MTIGQTAVAAANALQVVQWLEGYRATQPRSASLIVTPNVDHLVLLERDVSFRRAYDRALLRTADGAPVVWLANACARLRGEGVRLPGRVAGVDLMVTLLDVLRRTGAGVFLLGGRPETLTEAPRALGSRFPGLRLTGHLCPEPGFERTTGNDEVLSAIHRATPDYLLLFLGTPKQEIWFEANRDRLPPVIALGLGASLDMVCGLVPRAPRGVRHLGLEWAWRLLLEPRRLWRRYLVRDAALVRIALADMRMALADRRSREIAGDDASDGSR